MWQLVIFNPFWFLLLFLVHLSQQRRWRFALVFCILATAIFVVWRKEVVDPMVWNAYIFASFLTLWSGSQFGRWVFAKSTILDEEILDTSKRLERIHNLLRVRTQETEMVNKKASDIYYVYDKIKEMSQSLDKFETFLIFGEALYGQMRYRSVTLALFNEEEKGSSIPHEVYRLHDKDFEALVDIQYLHKNKKKFGISITPSLLKIFEHMVQSRERLHVGLNDGGFLGSIPESDSEYRSFTAYPIFIDKQLFAVLIIEGLQEAQIHGAEILTTRFITEIERVKLYEKVETLAITDGLTGVHVRRHLVERLEEEINRSRKFGLDLSFLMIDVDHFKRFNDQYGHLVGDVVLRQTAETIKKSIRELDLVGRYGGEEFAVLLVETDRSGATLAAERIRSAIAERKFRAYDENLTVTVSIGCATFPKAQAETLAVVETADQALYEAKRQGRNRVCIAGIE